jgi:hypothetical protein
MEPLRITKKGTIKNKECLLEDIRSLPPIVYRRTFQLNLCIFQLSTLGIPLSQLRNYPPTYEGLQSKKNRSNSSHSVGMEESKNRDL